MKATPQVIGLVAREAVRSLAYRLRPAVTGRAMTASTPLLRHVDNCLTYPGMHRFSADGPNGEYVVSVIAPNAPPPDGGYPLVVVLDGNAVTGAWADALSVQGPFATHCRIDPPMVVTIGYPGTRPIDLGRRAFDLLPPHSSRRWRDRFMQGAPWHQPGGADGFLDFVIGPLREDLAHRFPLNGDRHVLCGHSFGGLFALRTLLGRPRSFRKYVALSPSIWWDDHRLMREIAALLPELPDDLQADLLMAVGDDETPGRPRISEFMVADALAVAEQLKAAGHPGLKADCRVLPRETHQSVPFTMLSEVLRFASARKSS